MNYFSYFTEIEDAFIRRRGKHLLLSPMDWALIESWKEIKVPLHVVLRGIEKSFDSWESKPRKRTVKSLLYCQEEVEAQYNEWLEAHVGSGAESADSAAEQALPFQRAAILEHLERGQSNLASAAAKRQSTVDDDLAEALTRAAAQVAELRDDFADTTLPNAQKLEQSLTGIERLLSDALLAVASKEQLEVVEKEVKDQLKPYRKQMEPSVYEQTKNNLVLKRLRDIFGVPRLSLFYL